ncbi:Beta-xylosidase (XynB) (PDB:1PX8) [Commensalibacter communis]|uniref:GH39 family glycosyl hydrolase n=1 Tax=Commensalibacter communis TaxID=2972786 RepID=UPI0022FF61F6|nr:glycosyl hydrolase [Commensalibacter communis]CAI3957940.1 Beta-xylosidase (XynB) (PDB:1PX8) [Commensalibacter communis]CAI3958301.1 Beta-xylosidase (XynB) (PDB:1PX8) [Commensalibacter communis]
MVFTVNINKSYRNTSSGNNGLLKEVNGVNGMPISVAPGFPDLEDQFNQMGITHIRLHDCFGVGDIDNGFNANHSNVDQLLVTVPFDQQSKAKEFLADYANKRTIFPYAAVGMRNNDLKQALRSPNYRITDDAIRRTMKNNASVNPGNLQRQIMFRIGRTLDGGYEVPENFDIYAFLVSRLVMRYSINYKGIGLPRKVTYWEIWNEPDLTFFWNNNSPQVYYEFYAKIAKAIKAVDPTAKVGGPAVAYGYNPGGAYIDGLLNYCQTTNTPIDFFSWHYYNSSPQSIIDAGNYIQDTLNKHGFSNLESFCTEWNSTPTGTVNNFTKLQSAQNAAFLTSILTCMQYTKIDKAYYYRGDGAAFGLFNDQTNPKRPQNKNFCTYAAQGFNLFTRMFETPYILTQDNDFSTGLTTLVAENEVGNKINILASNFEMDTNFVEPAFPPNGYSLYPQYYLDSNRTTNQLDDDWSKAHWFGGVDPRTIMYNNEVPQRELVPQLPISENLPQKTIDYEQSRMGLTVNIANIPENYNDYKITAYRIKEGGRLDRMTPEQVTTSIDSALIDRVLTITDVGATSSTVTLYTVELIN